MQPCKELLQYNMQRGSIVKGKVQYILLVYEILKKILIFRVFLKKKTWKSGSRHASCTNNVTSQKSLKYVLEGTLLVKLKISKMPSYPPYTYKNFLNITFWVSFTALSPTLTEYYQTHEQYISKERKNKKQNSADISNKLLNFI